MENAIGIEAARARLGDIAEHARTTGQITALTRHGRTVAVIGPADAVQPSAMLQVLVQFPDDDHTVPMPALPRIGDYFEWTDDDGTESFWRVTDAIWSVSKNGLSIPGIELEPAPAPGETPASKED